MKFTATSGPLSAAGRRRLAAAYTVLTALIIVVSVILAPPPLLAGSAGSWLSVRLDPQGVLSAIAQSMPLLAGLLGLAAGLATWRSSEAQEPAADIEAAQHAAADPHAMVAAQLSAAVQALRDVLAQEGRELTSVREGFDSASHEAMVMSTRLAGAALDAEERLAASVARAERTLQRSESDIAGHAEAANGLRRDAAALDAAAREIALAGAGVVARIGEATSQLSSSALQLPGSAAAVMTTAQQSAAAMAEGLDALRRSTAVLDAAGEALGGMTSHMMDVVAAAASLPAALRAIDVSSHHPAVDPVLARLPAEWSNLSAQLGRLVAQLEGAASAQDLTDQRLELSLQRMQEAAEAMVQAAAGITGPHLAGASGTDGLAATLHHFDRVDRESEALHEQAAALAEAVLSGRAADLSHALTDQTPALLVRMQAAIGRLRSTATALALASDGLGKKGPLF